MLRATLVLVATLLVASRTAVGYGPPPGMMLMTGSGTYELAQHVILVRVVESFSKVKFPRALNPPNKYVPVRGRVRVLKSWDGPFSADQEIYVTPIMSCSGDGECTDYAFRVGDELVVFTQRTEEPILIVPSSTKPAAESLDFMAELDRAVKERHELEDPETDLIRAPGRYQAMFALKQCFTDASIHEEDADAYASCRLMDLSILVGIQRNELDTNWGPPTWCLDHNSPGPPYLLAAGTANCPPEQMAIWSFGRRGSSLACDGLKNRRCLDLTWIRDP
jgi:hypothetical protein